MLTTPERAAEGRAEFHHTPFNANAFTVNQSIGYFAASLRYDSSKSSSRHVHDPGRLLLAHFL
jgi:hypothetical protein